MVPEKTGLINMTSFPCFGYKIEKKKLTLIFFVLRGSDALVLAPALCLAEKPQSTCACAVGSISSYACAAGSLHYCAWAVNASTCHRREETLIAKRKNEKSCHVVFFFNKAIRAGRNAPRSSGKPSRVSSTGRLEKVVNGWTGFSPGGVKHRASPSGS